MEMSISFRDATLDDADELFEIVKDFATSFSPERSAFETSLRHIVGDETAKLMVALFEGQIAGYCLGFDHYAFYANGRVSWVEEIAVQEDFRKKGIGRQLMKAFEKWSVSRESRLVGLATRRASAFYEALDYENSATFYRKLL
jgi:GNAT superfamily N-acetyltransferase